MVLCRINMFLNSMGEISSTCTIPCWEKTENEKYFYVCSNKFIMIWVRYLRNFTWFLSHSLRKITIMHIHHFYLYYAPDFFKRWNIGEPFPYYYPSVWGGHFHITMQFCYPKLSLIFLKNNHNTHPIVHLSGVICESWNWFVCYKCHYYAYTV